MHDRRIDGTAYIFGNAGALFMNAMTWYDHETGSVWSQPWGRAIQGPLKGVQLNLLPSQLTTWGNWKGAFPHTLVMSDDTEFLGLRRDRFQPNFVIGLVLGQDAKAYAYEHVERTGVINDLLGNVPVLVWARDEIYQAYIRVVDERVLTFSLDGEILVDVATGTRWDPQLGLGINGPLAGRSLQPVPSLSSYPWAWLDLYTKSEFYKP